MSDTLTDFIMEKIYADPIRPSGGYDWDAAEQRDEMKELVEKVIRQEFDVVELATDSWYKETTKRFLERIEPELLANHGIASWYKAWLDVQRQTEGDDYGLDNPRDRAATGTPTNKL